MFVLVRERPGDDTEAPCYGLDKDKGQSVPHQWRMIDKKPVQTDFGWRCPCGQSTGTPFLDHCFYCAAPFPVARAPEFTACDCAQEHAVIRIETCDCCGGVRSLKAEQEEPLCVFW